MTPEHPDYLAGFAAAREMAAQYHKDRAKIHARDARWIGPQRQYYEGPRLDGVEMSPMNGPAIAYDREMQDAKAIECIAPNEQLYHSQAAEYKLCRERLMARSADAEQAEAALAEMRRALERAVTYIELTYDEEMGEEAAAAKHDLDMARAALARHLPTTPPKKGEPRTHR